MRKMVCSAYKELWHKEVVMVPISFAYVSSAALSAGVLLINVMNETRALLIISSSAESSLVGVWDSKSRMPSTNSLMVISLLRFLYAKEKEEKILSARIMRAGI
jgi:hypothetical protein